MPPLPFIALILFVIAAAGLTLWALLGAGLPPTLILLTGLIAAAALHLLRSKT